MLTATRPGAPGIIVHVPHHPGNATHRRQSVGCTSHRRSSAYSGGSGCPRNCDSAIDINGISIDRVMYLRTALDALPGVALREYFAPVMRLKKQLLLRQRSVRQRFPSCDTVEGAAAYAKMVTDALTSLTRALNTAGGDLMLDEGTGNLSLEPKEVIACLKDKVAPVSIEAGGVLVYPREPPEASFVYIVMAGTVSATFFQPQAQSQSSAPQQQRRGGGLGVRRERRMYFTSAKDVVRLCGGGLAPEVALTMDDYPATDSVGCNNSTVAGGGRANDDGTSVSNVTTAIQRSLRRASRTVGQPTLRPTGTEQVRAPVVLGAGEAFGLAPFKYVCYTASTTPTVAPTSGTASTASKSAKGNEGATYEEFVDTFRIRTSDVHAALIDIAARQRAERLQRSPHRYVPWCTAAKGEIVPRGTVRTVADFIVAARRRSLYSDYAATELLLRQSWLLQDVPAPTIRALISHMVPRTYMPGEVMACPHTPGSSRQLCFLRRGRLNVFVSPKSGGSPAPLMSGELPNDLTASRSSCERCGCWYIGETTRAQPAEVVESGASFGELSVLFHEPRHCVLRADTVCDVWCLPHRSFTALMQRDAALRDGLLQKAAVLRVEWMGEQRFTHALAQQLRAGSELLKPLPDVAIRLIQERLEPVIYTPGSLVASTSTRCTEMIFIMGGTVSTLCEGVAAYGTGDVLGEGCLIPHRWPLGLAARTMVEGWRIKVKHLIDALRRMDLLHRYSGLVTSQTPQLMKKIFGTPQPEIEVDAVGRQRMPTVGAPPGGFASYLIYGRAVSEVQLKALCFLYRDYVRWEDINYSTMDRGADKAAAVSMQTTLNALAHDVAVSRLSGGKGQPVSAALDEHQKRRNIGDTGDKSWKTVVKSAAVAAAPPTTASPLPRLDDAPAAAGSGRNAARTNSGRRQPTRQPRVGGCRGPEQRFGNAGAFLVKQAFLGEEVPSKAAASLAKTHAHGSHRHPPLPPRLHRMVRLLEERNRTWAAEQCHEASLAQQGMIQRDVTIWNRAVLRSTATPGTPVPNSHPFRFATAAATTATMAHLRTATGVFSDTHPAPVHIFLQGEKPKYELTLDEAIAVGYVLQLPSIAQIQHSVSLVDPDVALGPPAQRGRRYLMSITPNDRYTKHNFLFAAADLKDGNSAESHQKTAEAKVEATLRSKTRKLLTMMRTAVASRMDGEAAFASAVAFHPTTISGECSTADSGAVAPPPDTLVLVNESQVQSLDSDTEGLANSPPAVAATPSPDRSGRQQTLLSSPGIVVLADSMETLSPLGSPGKVSSQRKEAAFQRLVKRNAAQAIELLCKHYDISWSFSWPGLPSDMTSQMRHGVGDGHSANGSGYMTPPGTTSLESQRRAQQLQKPSLLERLEAAATSVVRNAIFMSGLPLPPLVLPRELSESATDAEAPQRSDTDADDGGALLTSNRTLSYPQLVRATARDRWHSANQLTARSAPPFTSELSVPLLSQKVAGTNMATSDTTAKVAVPGAGLVEHFYHCSQQRRAPVLFVEGYGPLQPLLESWIEYPPTIHASAVGGSEPYAGNVSIDRVGGGGSQFSRPTTSIAAAAALRRSASRPGGLSGSFRGGGVSHQHYPLRGSNVSASGSSGQMAPWVEEFTMPNAEATEMYIRRIQRDINGLNAVAKEQQRERNEAHARNGRTAKYVAAMEAALGKPNKEELEALEAWRTQYRHVGSEARRRASLPVALRTEAGQDYMKRELEYLVATPALMDDPVWRYTSGVQEWQDQQANREEGTSLFSGALIEAGSGANVSGAGAASALDRPRRVVATIGAASLGFTPAPLQSPSAQMSPGDYEAWVHEREDFFAAYKRFLTGRGGDGGRGGWAVAPAAPLAAPKMRFTPAPPSLRPSLTSATWASSPTPPSEALAEQPADFRTSMNPRSEDSDVYYV
ncbi:conserved hypothetical protein [Leishmania braziliensis MHOM/BR/75/M2904]|uniref:Cyclic nucleotide-binding domain-containing protein n=2 Tax=Leishmania braziliensis TaxID=5660 RepID=A4HHB6_LEIBR|nr:conserved hypothetical protein [Leishmania braziliensis MHOM/BR/75/M2904]CAJ2476476.1 unnamed protein product [Leishmania braziliensis]CAM39968.2 conserved hypothetical protein [Leishmania braziliensis MHOM/BR/75/M2904]SYZ67631.1 Flagellar_Member_6 [Leishmania braziliensis MHOM/BR/75/M2904]